MSIAWDVGEKEVRRMAQWERRKSEGWRNVRKGWMSRGSGIRTNSVCLGNTQMFLECGVKARE